jgi:hypothetical protein
VTKSTPELAPNSKFRRHRTHAPSGLWIPQILRARISQYTRSICWILAACFRFIGKQCGPSIGDRNRSRSLARSWPNSIMSNAIPTRLSSPFGRCIFSNFWILKFKNKHTIEKFVNYTKPCSSLFVTHSNDIVYTNNKKWLFWTINRKQKFE